MTLRRKAPECTGWSNSLCVHGERRLAAVQEKAGFVRDGETTLYSRPRGAEFPHVNTVLTRARFEQLS